MHGTETMVYSYQQPVLLLWRTVTFSERAPTLNPFLTEKECNDRHMQWIQFLTNTVDTRTLGVSGDSQRQSQSLLSSRTGAYSVQC